MDRYKIKWLIVPILLMFFSSEGLSQSCYGYEGLGNIQGSTSATVGNSITYFFQVNYSVGCSYSNYQWTVSSGGNITYSSKNSVTITWTSSGSKTIRYYAGIYMVQVDSHPVSVASSCTTSYQVTGTGTRCETGPGIDIGLSGSTSGVTYTLYLGSGTVYSISGTGGALSWPGMTSAGTYTVKASGGGCSSALMTGSAIISVDQQSIGGTAIGGSEVISPNVASGTLSLTGNVGSISSWEYSLDETNWSGSSNSYSLSSPGKVFYRAQVKNGSCPAVTSSTTFAAVYDASISSTVSALPFADPTGGQLSVQDVFDTYAWSYNDQALPSETGPSIQINNPGTYSVSVTKDSPLSGILSHIEDYTVDHNLTAMSNMNYIYSMTILKEGMLSEADFSTLGQNEVAQSISYFDGLGRPLQSIGIGASPLGNDVVQPVWYDEFGRQAVNFLPYAATDGVSGLYKANAIGLFDQIDPTSYNVSDQKIFYDGKHPGETPYAVTVFEPSPLNRVLEQGAPGTDWQPDLVTPANGKTIKMGYHINDL
ncbi:MAG: DUF6443 domain-containing protein, partial [Cyclobacteriaceae bacterium]|nr:DUF6443 domain-containing protein [Cyclobacteriaceae bacterium]